MENKKSKRYYKVDELVWIIKLKKVGKVESINKKNLTMNVSYDDIMIYAGKMWEFDKLKYSYKEKVDEDVNKSVESVIDDNLREIKKMIESTKKFTYFSSVNGGVVPTKDKENAGRDCYARLEPQIRGGKKVFELHIPKLTLAKIPLGFASYLNTEDLLSLKHERSSVGSTGMINVSGLIDSTYQGEVILQVVPLIADIIISSEVEDKHFDEATNIFYVPYHKAIAQAVVMKQSEAEDVNIPYEELLNKPSTRGTGGWGSSGK